ncbi:energy transducer TonB [Bradyrhizobium manausense]|uniref:cell envelope integrity protein TolA n=1 Tax=Bradyrhizobium manausense TaxID=989370 RepID=UPI001BA52C9A|nr:TonB family protein [Bradyrhizobium manausense]MBR1086902.1 energy transducer TonB [Bradyrhizobium manausense]
MTDPVFEAKSSRTLWILAAVAAIGLHLGGAALALANLRADDGNDGLGANGAEYAVELTSPKLPDTDLPPGPDSEASQYQPQQKQQQAEVKETDLPKEVPQEAEDPDRLVTENDSKKPVEETTKVAKVETQAVEEMPNAQESARQALNENAREDEKAAAPHQGIGKDIGELTANWGKRISAYFEIHKRYPKDRINTKDKIKTTTVKLNLVLNRRGNVVSVEVAESSGDPAFDEAAISMVRRSDPVPVPPAELTEDQFSFNLPVNFKKPAK